MRKIVWFEEVKLLNCYSNTMAQISLLSGKSCMRAHALLVDHIFVG